MTDAPVVAVVVAAGSGTRLGGERPKALRELDGRTLVARSVDALRAAATQIVVVAPAAYLDEVDGLLGTGDAVSVVAGGRHRQESVRRGLQALDPGRINDAVVLVHDAARPLVPAAVVTRVVAAVRAGASAVIPVVPVTDTIRRLDQDRSEVVDRSLLRAVQTPQGFALSAVWEAHELGRERGLEATDDAALCELAGHRVVLVDGSPLSVKITHPVDLLLAEAILAAAASS